MAYDVVDGIQAQMIDTVVLKGHDLGMAGVAMAHSMLTIGLYWPELGREILGQMQRRLATVKNLTVEQVEVMDRSRIDEVKAEAEAAGIRLNTDDLSKFLF